VVVTDLEDAGFEDVAWGLLVRGFSVMGSELARTVCWVEVVITWGTLKFECTTCPYSHSWEELGG
jgi:hypothetical protein